MLVSFVLAFFMLASFMLVPFVFPLFVFAWFVFTSFVLAHFMSDSFVLAYFARVIVTPVAGTPRWCVIFVWRPRLRLKSVTQTFSEKVR